MTPQDYTMLVLLLLVLTITAWLFGKYWDELGGVVSAGCMRIAAPKKTELRVVGVSCQCGFRLDIPDVPSYNTEKALESIREFHDQVCEHPFLFAELEEVKV